MLPTALWSGLVLTALVLFGLICWKEKRKSYRAGVFNVSHVWVCFIIVFHTLFSYLKKVFTRRRWRSVHPCPHTCCLCMSFALNCEPHLLWSHTVEGCCLSLSNITTHCFLYKVFFFIKTLFIYKSFFVWSYVYLSKRNVLSFGFFFLHKSRIFLF